MELAHVHSIYYLHFEISVILIITEKILTNYFAQESSLLCFKMSEICIITKRVNLKVTLLTYAFLYYSREDIVRVPRSTRALVAPAVHQVPTIGIIPAQRLSRLQAFVLICWHGHFCTHDIFKVKGLNIVEIILILILFESRESSPLEIHLK